MQKPLSPLFFPFFEDNLPEAVAGAARSLLGSSGTLAERKATPAGAMGMAFFHLGAPCCSPEQRAWWALEPPGCQSRCEHVERPMDQGYGYTMVGAGGRARTAGLAVWGGHCSLVAD